MANLRRSIYIGIGGAGVKAIAYTKKMFEEAFGVGNIPEAIQFLAIDSDFAALYDSLHPAGISECAVRLKTDVRLPDVYTLQKHLGRINWMFPENVRFLPPIYLGAAQVRTNGRLFIELCMSEVLDGIRNRYDRVMNAPINHWGSVDIHIVCSLAGGTGSGAFIPLACMIRNMYGNGVNIFGYGLMDGVFRAMGVARTQTSNVRINTYAAVLDLDYFQSASQSDPVRISVANKDIVLAEPLFDRYYLMDNVSENGHVVTSVNELCEMMAGAMYVYGAEAGCEFDGYWAAVGWKSGMYDVENKIGWVYRFGICELVYGGESLADMFLLQAKNFLLQQFSSSSLKGAEVAKCWVGIAGVREGGEEYSMLIDRICSPEELVGKKILTLNLNDAYNETRDKVNKYVNDYLCFFSERETSEISDQLRADLWKEVSCVLNKEGGLSEAKGFLDALKDIFDGYIVEKKEEIKDLAHHILQGESALNAVLEECARYIGSFFKRRKVKQECLDTIEHQTRNLLRLKIELKRREVAAEILKIIAAEVDVVLDKVNQTQHSVEDLKSRIGQEISRRNRADHVIGLMYDISVKEQRELLIDSNEVSLADFLATLTKPVFEMTGYEFNDALTAYCVSLPRYEEYRSKSLKDVISGLTDEECEHIKWFISDRICPFLKLNDRGEINVLRGYPPVGAIMAVIYDPEAVQNLGSVLRCMPSDAWHDPVVVSAKSDYHRQKMMLYRIDAAIIPYCVDTLDLSMQHKYEAHIAGARYNPHIDLQIYEDMKRKDFKLKPEKPDEAMFYWVCGQIFGWPEAQRCVAEVGYPEKYICYMHQRYMFWNPNLAQGGIWHEFHSSNRVRAFEYFKTELLPYLRDDYDELISQKNSERGMIYYRHLIGSLRSDGKQRYVETVLRETPRMPMEDDVSFIDEEWTYIEEKLLEALQLTKL